MDMRELLSRMLMLVLIMAIGVLAYKRGYIDSDGNRKISRMILYVTQPAMILNSAVTAELDIGVGGMLKIMLSGWVMYAVLFVLAYALSPLFGRQRQKRGVCRFLLVFANVAFMGFPVVEALYGTEAVAIAALHVIPFNVLAYSAGVLMLTGGGEETKIDRRQILTPVLIASVAAAFLMAFRLRFPGPLTQALGTLGGMTVPGAMLVIGVTLGSASLGEVFRDWRVYVVSALRLILSPLAVWAVMRGVLQPLLGLQRWYMDMLVVLSAMPAASTTTMLCLEHGIDPKLGSSGVFVSTVLSIATVPLMIWLLL